MSGVVSFAGGSIGLCNKDLLQGCLSKVSADCLLEYGDPSGTPTLRETLARVLVPVVGPSLTSDRVLVCSGGQQAACLALDACLSQVPAPGCVLVRQPCFFGVLRHLRERHAESRVVPWQTAQELVDLARANPGAVVYCTSNHSPEAIPASLDDADKARVLAAAAEHSCTIVEDNPYDLAWFGPQGQGARPGTLFSLASASSSDRKAAVVFASGLSKVLAPGLRLGFVAWTRNLQGEFAKRLRGAKISADLFTSPLCQSLAEVALSESGLFSRLSSWLLSRRDWLLAALRAELGTDDRVSWDTPSAGVFVKLSWIPATDGGEVRPFSRVCPRHGVKVEPSCFSYVDGKERPHTRLNFGHLATCEEAVEGVRRLRSAFEEYYGGRPGVVTVPRRNLTVLITSGGTAVPLDGVRVLTNLSQGSTAASIAEELLRRGHRVIYLYSRQAKRPFLRHLCMDTSKPAQEETARLLAVRAEYDRYSPNLTEVEYFTFNEYFDACKRVLQSEGVNAPRVDVAIFAAAVSDFGFPNNGSHGQGKIRSDKELTVTLGLLPKVITLVRGWHRTVFLVTFKLMVESSVDQLVEVAHASGMVAKADLVVANTVAAGNLSRRQTVIVTPEKGVTPTTTAGLAKDLAELIERRFSVSHYSTELQSGLDLSTVSEGVATMRLVASEAARLGLWLPYSEKDSETGPEFGFVAVRVPGQGFLITGRGSRKSPPHDLPDKEVVLVTHVDQDSRKIVAKSPFGSVKASLNANVAAAIFDRRPEANVIFHTHVMIPSQVSTSIDRAPGTAEDLREVLSALDGRPSAMSVGLANHGAIFIGGTWKDITEAIGERHTYTLYPAKYDLTYSRFLESVNEFVSLAAMETPNLRSGARVLDIAAGTCAVSEGLARMGCLDFVVLDASDGMLQVGVEKIRARSPSARVEKVVSSMADMRLPDEAFDLVTCRQAINYAAESVDSLSLVFARVCRTLKEGGKFVFNAPNFVDDSRRRAELVGISTFDLTSPDGGRVKVREANSLEHRKLWHSQYCVVTYGGAAGSSDEKVRRETVYDLNSFTLFTVMEFTSALLSAGFTSGVPMGKGLVTPCPDSSRSLYIVATK